MPDPDSSINLAVIETAGHPVSSIEQLSARCNRSSLRLQIDPDLNRGVADLANHVLTAEFDVLVLVTGAGTRYLLQRCLQTVPQERFIACLADMTTVAGSSESAAVMRELQVEPSVIVARSTRTQKPAWRELLIALDQQCSVSNQLVAIEQTGDSGRLIAGLESRGARVRQINPVLKAAPEPSVDWAQWMHQLQQGAFDAVCFTSPAAVWAWQRWAEQQALEVAASWLFRIPVIACDQPTSEVLLDQGIAVDWIAPEGGLVEDQIVTAISQAQTRKERISMTLSGPATSASDPEAPWYNNPFMQACRGEPTDVTPVWMMRQAGRYMKEYRAVREKVSFLELCHNPELCSEVMCTAVNRLGVDVAIIFSDLLPILVPMGCDLEFVAGDGPVIHNPIRTNEDLDRIQPLANNGALQFVMEAVKQTRNDLPADMPLIGFAGAPFTLASYMIEGGSSRHFAHTKRLMFGDRSAWSVLMQKLTDSIIVYLQGQVEAGVQCVQLFDSWAGCLGFEDYRQSVLPYVKQIIGALSPHVPVINFATGNPALLPLLADTSAAVIGVDWRVRLDDAWQTVGHDRAVQGNLDPNVLLTNPAEIRKQVAAILEQAAGRPGHIFNLGHGILPSTPVDNAIALVDAVHELSTR